MILIGKSFLWPHSLVIAFCVLGHTLTYILPFCHSSLLSDLQTVYRLFIYFIICLFTYNLLKLAITIYRNIQLTSQLMPAKVFFEITIQSSNLREENIRI